MIIIKKILIFSLLFILGILFSLSLIRFKLVADNFNNTFIIYIDPGHGGFDGGCTSLDKVYKEKDITLEISLLLSSYLRSSGIIVKLTRENDISLAGTKKEDIYKRVDLINKSNANLYLSIHANSFPSSIVSGAQVFYNSNNDNNKKIAEILTNKIHLIDRANNRTALPIKNKYLVDNVNITGCLIEVGFLTNINDLDKLKNKNYISDFVQLLYIGIVEYLDYLK